MLNNSPSSSSRKSGVYMGSPNAPYPTEALPLIAISSGHCIKNSILNQTSQPPITPKPTVLPNGQTSGWRVSLEAFATTNRTIGPHGCPLPNSVTITRQTPLPEEAPSRPSMGYTLDGIPPELKPMSPKQKNCQITWSAYGTKSKQPCSTTKQRRRSPSHPTTWGTGSTLPTLTSKPGDLLRSWTTGK